MNPWLLHEVRKDDVSAKYKEAERFRLAAMATKNTSRPRETPGRPDDLSGMPRAAQKRVARLVAILATGAALITVLFAAVA